MYHASDDRAGELLARYHEVYALDRSMENCLNLSGQLVQESEQLQYEWITGQALLEKGNCRWSGGDIGGRGDFERALARAHAKGYRTLELRAFGLLVGDATSLRNQVVAWQQITDRLATYWEAPYSPIRAHQFYSDLSTSSSVLGHRYASVIFRRAAVEEISKTPYGELQAQTRTILASLEDVGGLKDEAEREFGNSAELFARCRRTASLDKQFFYAEVKRAEFQVKNAPEAALNRLAKMLLPGDRFPSVETELMFYQAQGRARLMLGDREGAGVAFQRAVLCSEQTLASLLTAVDRGGPLRKGEDAYRGSVEIYLGRNAEEALKLWEWYRAGDLRGSRRPLDLRASLPVLSSDLILSYALLPSGSVVVWALGDRPVECKRLPIRAEQIEPVANRFLRECADPRSSISTLRRDGRQLYDWLIAPVAHLLVSGRALVFETDGPIGSIPLQALVDADGRYLGERFPIVVSRGLIAYQERKGLKPLTRASPALVIADPALGGDMIKTFPPLEEAAREAREIAALFPRGRLLAGKTSTLEAITVARRDVELFHFAGHGVSEEADGGLLLSPSREDSAGAQLLKASRLAGEDWSHCSLAVLSACSTGTGERNSFVNPESLVRGFLNAGVGRVIASRWNVDTEATAGFVRRFYESVLSGAVPSSALRQASEALRSRPPTAHPYYWAAFQLFGYK
jgi:CHAT domain-containing protein